MAEVPGEGKACKEFEPGLPWEQALDLIAPDLPPHAALDVHLSGALAPGILLEFPEGLRQYRDRLAYATAACARLLGRPSASVRCELDPFNLRICVAVDGDVDQALGNWSERQRLLVRRCEPLWGHLSGRKDMRAVPLAFLREPDSLTALWACGDGSTAAVSSPVEPYESYEAAVRRALVLVDAVAEGLGPAVRIRFELCSSAGTLSSPAPWAAHWSRS